MQETSIRQRAARLGTVLRAVADTAAEDRAVNMLAYAAVGMLYPGEAPKTTAQLIRCSLLLDSQPWMREPAFEFLSKLAGSSWPYIVADWSVLHSLLLLDDATVPDHYAPKAHAHLHAINSRLCGKSFCTHPLVDHAFENGAHRGHCSVAGCKCGYYKAPQPCERAQ